MALEIYSHIDHDTLFVILEKYVGITGSALQLLKSYFSDRSQRVLIDDVMSGVANLVCGVPQGSVLGPLKFCLYLLPLGAILRYHSIDYHIMLMTLNSIYRSSVILLWHL